MIILSVRPEDWPSVVVSAPGKLVMSVMAGIPLADIVDRLETDRVVRALPNAAAEVAASYSPWIASPAVTEGDRTLVRELLSACGTEDEVGEEANIDYLTGLSGSGPAFPALLADAMMKDALRQGIQANVALRAVQGVLKGAGRLLDLHGSSPAETVEAFVAYRGTTAAAISSMRVAGFDAAVASGLAAAADRSKRMKQDT
jgi:pyrroline-5-carboxylate reductase